MIAVASIPPIGHDEAMDITAEENARVLRLLQGLSDEDWARPTDCTGWDVRKMVLHIVGSVEAQASLPEFGRQLRAARPLTKEIGGHHWVDGMNEKQIRDRASLATADLPAAWEKASARALKARRRMPGFIRALPVLPIGPPIGTKPVAYLFDMGFTRDAWTHRVDLTQATGRPMELTGAHDGRIIGDIVREWAALHGEPFVLRLTGEAGGTYTSGTGGDEQEVDAVEFVRILAGRAAGDGVLRHPLPL